MSNNYSDHRTWKAKQIKVRPIEVNNEDSPDSTEKSLEEQQKSLQTEINEAREELQKLKEQQLTLINQTNTEIEAAKKNWEKEKQQYIEQAKEAGYTEGFQNGKQESLEHYKQMLQKTNNMVESATKDYHSTIEKSEETILELSVHVAEKIIKKELSEHKETFISIVHTAVTEVKNQSKISIYVHPEKYELVIGQKEEIARLAGEETDLSIYVNDDLDEEGCYIEHPFGRIDCSVDTQLQELRKVLHETSMERSE